ncbi:hypothetical protein [Bacillus cereus]|uniref:Uncharacterized protein n=1 Tax=Bacillus cereus TaxID=1396 RepID=A0A1S9U4J6_BACCE|nr:hypothetical protein [Bacillus cereus]OOR17170.1 hypothetical protein BW892_27805 [Bacillus cereus]
MKIKDILNLTQTMRVSEIAKDLEIGEKKAVAGLKKAGCTFTSGRSGWYLAEGTDEGVLEKSIYDYAPIGRSKAKNVVNSAKREVSATVEAEVVNNPSSQLPDKTDSKEENKPTNKQISKQVGKPIDRLIGKQIRKPIGKPSSKSVMKKVTYEIETQLHNELKIKAIREDRTVSDIVNEIIKTALNK